jgi:hypothetical protein
MAPDAPLVHHGRGIDAVPSGCDGGGDRQISLEGYAFAPKFTPMEAAALHEVRKGWRRCGWRNSIPDAASRCCQDTVD